MQTPFKTVNAALQHKGITPVDVSDERSNGDPIFVYLGTNGLCRDDGAHMLTGHTAKEILNDLATVTPCDCDECK